MFLTKCYSEEMDREFSIYGENRNVSTVLVGKLEGSENIEKNRVEIAFIFN